MSEHITEWLGAYHDGELGPAATRRVAAHLAECADCRAALEELRRLSDLLDQPVPGEAFLTADRFAANLALQLPRLSPDPKPRTNGRLIAWWAVPVGLLAALVFIEITFSMTTAISLAADSGLFGSSLDWLQGGPAQMSWFASATRLLGDRLGAAGWAGLSLLNDAGVLIAQLTRPLLLHALIAAAYLGWLLAWWIGNASQAVRENG